MALKVKHFYQYCDTRIPVPVLIFSVFGQLLLRNRKIWSKSLFWNERTHRADSRWQQESYFIRTLINLVKSTRKRQHRRRTNQIRPGRGPPKISKTLNEIFETNNEEVKLGTGVLIPPPKLKKTQWPVKNLRPLTLLEAIRKIISKIFMNRTEHQINRYLAQSQSAYMKSSSTADIIWAHRWIIAKTQMQDITVYITGIISIRRKCIRRNSKGTTNWHS